MLENPRDARPPVVGAKGRELAAFQGRLCRVFMKVCAAKSQSCDLGGARTQLNNRCKPRRPVKVSRPILTRMRLDEGQDLWTVFQAEAVAKFLPRSFNRRRAPSHVLPEGDRVANQQSLREAEMTQRLLHLQQSHVQARIPS